MTGETEGKKPCRRCDGCGKIANSEDGEPWSFWENLPSGSDIMVKAGLVRPITCPECAGSGRNYR